MSITLFIRAEEIAEELGVSKPYAYKLVRKLNEELSKKGFITISGRVSRAYYKEKVYSKEIEREKGV
jgi:transposase